MHVTHAHTCVLQTMHIALILADMYSIDYTGDNCTCVCVLCCGRNGVEKLRRGVDVGVNIDDVTLMSRCNVRSNSLVSSK